MRFLLLSFCFTLAACGTTLKNPVVTGKPSGLPIQAYASVLEKHVNDKGQVDFEGLRDNPTDLHYYVRYVNDTPLSSFQSEDEKLAHVINAYNALSMFTVIERGIPETNSGLNKVYFFYWTDMNIAGEMMSLYTFENDIIRKMGEERIHFALNCMAVSCPQLPKKPFTPEKIRDELEKETKFFFSEERNLRVVDAEKKIYLSEILDFFTDDFVPKKAQSLIAYINRYRENKIPEDYEVEFIDYDWTINNSNKLKANLQTAR